VPSLHPPARPQPHHIANVNVLLVRLHHRRDGCGAAGGAGVGGGFDGGDIAHLIRGSGRDMNWQRLLDRFGPHWRLLLSHLVMFGFIYPSERDIIPAWVLDELTGRLKAETAKPPPNERICQGTLISRAQYLVDIEQWGYADARLAAGHMEQADIDLWTDAIATEQPTPATRPTYRSE
jgi:hypothetical protein